MASVFRRGRPRRDAQLAARRREQILSAAAEVFAGRGYPDTEMQNVADAANVAKGTIYCYFPSKERLFLATVDRALVRLKEYVKSKYELFVDPLKRLEIGVRAYLQFFRDHPDHAELLIIERAVYRDRKTPTYIEHRRANAGEWEAVFAELIRDGRVRNVPVRRILRVVSDLVYGSMFASHFGYERQTPAEQAKDVIDILFHGILAPAERSRRRKHRRTAT